MSTSDSGLSEPVLSLQPTPQPPDALRQWDLAKIAQENTAQVMTELVEQSLQSLIPEEEIPVTIQRKRKKAGRKPGTPKTGGRSKGVRNRATVAVRLMAQELVNDKMFQKNFARKFRNGTLDPSLTRMVFAYAAGKPPEKIEVTGEDGKPIEINQKTVVFYIPDNFRPRMKKE